MNTSVAISRTRGYDQILTAQGGPDVLCRSL
jgi:hypothetical protein